MSVVWRFRASLALIPRLKRLPWHFWPPQSVLLCFVWLEGMEGKNHTDQYSAWSVSGGKGEIQKGEGNRWQFKLNNDGEAGNN